MCYCFQTQCSGVTKVVPLVFEISLSNFFLKLITRNIKDVGANIFVVMHIWRSRTALKCTAVHTWHWCKFLMMCSCIEWTKTQLTILWPIVPLTLQFSCMSDTELLLRKQDICTVSHEIIKRKANWIGHILHRNCLLKQVVEGKIKGHKWQEDKEEGVRSYWTTFRTGDDTVNWRRKLWIALCEGTVLQEALDLSFDRLLMMMIFSVIVFNIFV